MKTISGLRLSRLSTWFCIPSKRPAAEVNATLNIWRAQGYKIAIWRDAGDEEVICDLQLSGTYPGYPVAVNALCRSVIEHDTSAEWLVTGGDDTEPDPNKRADEIAAECTAHFGGTFGVVQPTGDRWAGGQIDRICGSPFMGREWCERAHGGSGPLWYEYWHMFVDEDLHNVARKLGVLWQRRDLTHKHNHFCRVENEVDWVKGRAEMPAFLREANSPEHWNKYKALFERRRREGFPGHEPTSECATSPV